MDKNETGELIAAIHSLGKDKVRELALLLWQHIHEQEAESSPVIPDGWVMVPKTPSNKHLESIATRHRHDFYILDDARRESALSHARQMYEECSGQGFYEIPSPPTTEK